MHKNVRGDYMLKGFPFEPLGDGDPEGIGNGGGYPRPG